MEVFSRLTQYAINDAKSFKYPPKCASFHLIHLDFADDLLFCSADLGTINPIRKVLQFTRLGLFIFYYFILFYFIIFTRLGLIRTSC